MPQDDDLSSTVFDDLAAWIQNSSSLLICSAFALSYSVFLAVQPSSRSTFFCSSISDSSTYIVFLQWLGLVLDAVSLVILWRILAWARTTKNRLRTLGTVLLLISTALGLLWVASRLSGGLGEVKYKAALKGVHSLYVFDICVDSLAFATLLISTSLVISETGPATPITTICSLCGFLACIRTTHLRGTFLQKSRSATLIPIYILLASFTIFLYAHHVRSVLFIRRVILVVLLYGVVIYATVYTMVKGDVLVSHPLQDIIYNTRIEADKWLRHASISTSLPVAVNEYLERNNGRDPPPNFDKWYAFARERGLIVMDHFEQIQKDIQPFWGMSPDQVRINVDRISSQPRVGIIKVADGKVSYEWAETREDERVLGDAVDMINKFAQHLPDMKLPINLDERPRILATWEEVHSWTEASKRSKFKLLSKRSLLPRDDSDSDSDDASEAAKSANRTVLATRPYRQMGAVACPPGSAARSGLHWNVRDFCAACAAPQSQGQFPTDWRRAQDLCHQPDVTRLHGFYMRAPRLQPFQELLPLFSRAKTDSFNDVLIPLTRPFDQTYWDPEPDFDSKPDRVYWRANLTDDGVSHQSVRGSHPARLAHLLNNASATDAVTLLLPLVPPADDANAPKPAADFKFAYASVPARAAAAALPLDVGFAESSPPCASDGCAIARQEFGVRRPGEGGSTTKLLLDNRYVLLLDSDDGPPRNLADVLRSNSAPVVASLFKEWFSERLMPWIHFVPLDVRLHGLHSTVAYFTGFKAPTTTGGGGGGGGEGDGKVAVVLAGRRVDAYRGRPDDGRWIAEQGKRWAAKALRNEDMEIYLFRLLLEWGRVMSDDRDEIGYAAEEVL